MNPFKQLWLLGKLGWAGITVLRDPNRLDQVFGVADGLAETQPRMMADMAKALAVDPVGAAALAERPRVGLLDVKALAAMPEGTFGRAAGDYFVRNGLDPAALPQRPASDDSSYMQAHLYETHDLWHVVTGFGTDVAGELGLQAFYAAQVPGKLPWALLAIGLLNTLFFSFDDGVRRLEAITRGWRMGREAKQLFGVRWAELLGAPLGQVRAQLKVTPVEPLPQAPTLALVPAATAA